MLKADFRGYSRNLNNWRILATGHESDLSYQSHRCVHRKMKPVVRVSKRFIFTIEEVTTVWIFPPFFYESRAYLTTRGYSGPS
jgi:hypothetical protein